MTTVTEIAPEIFRLETYAEPINLQFCQFLVRDDEPLLFHTGMRGIFPQVREAVATLIDPTRLRWIGFSHFEADECGAVREWQDIALHSTVVCTVVGKYTSVDDVVARREARAMQHHEVLVTGSRRFRFLQTPHVPHGWDASMFYEETSETLFCSDILTQRGHVPPLDEAGSILERFRSGMTNDQVTPWAHAYPCSEHTAATYGRLAALNPKTLAIMHGSSYTGAGGQLLSDYAAALSELESAAPKPAAVGNA